MFTDKDVKAAKPYVVIGQTIVDELFGLQNPVGKTLRLKGKPFTVIGTLKAKGDGLMGDDQDNIVIMPSATLRQRLEGSDRPEFVNIAFVKAVSDTIHKIRNVKIAFDIACVIMAVFLSLIFFNLKIVGIREGTVIAALCTGLVVKFLSKLLLKMM